MNSKNRAAAISAGYASRQRPVSLLKDSTSAWTAPPQSQSAHISQVQQLVNGFEQSLTSNKFQAPGTSYNASGRNTSRTSSQVAARIASGTSISPPEAPSTLHNGGKDDNAVSDTNILLSTHGPESQARPPESTQAPIEKPTITASRAVRSVSSCQTGSVAAAVDHNSTNVKDDALSEHFGRGRSSTAHRRTLERKIVPRNTLQYSIPDESHSVTDERDSSRGRSGRSVSNPTAYSPTQSAQFSHRLPSISRTHYLDERTGLTEVSLADAIVASSLASSRAPSPARNVPAPPPPRRSSLSRALFRHLDSSDTNLPRHGGPHHGMRQTLRKYESDDTDDESERRKHRHFMKHPNKHHEGSRKRWKDKVTDRERKRYEGVWAANKGLFLTSLPTRSNEEATNEISTSESVLDLVVRDIWSRSRLPTDTLAEIWDLVDRQGVGRLTRDEFVLGLWLIDQRLKGRKLPVRVAPTLWASVRHAWGMRISQR